MRWNMKKALIGFLAGMVLFLGGCKARQNYNKVDPDPAQTNSFQNGFNEEHYIWEGWNVPGPRK